MVQKDHFAVVPILHLERMRGQFRDIGSVDTMRDLPARLSLVEEEIKVIVFRLANGVENTLRRNPNGGGWYSTSQPFESNVGTDVHQDPRSVIFHSNVYRSTFVGEILVVNSDSEGLDAHGRVTLIGSRVNADFAGRISITDGTWAQGSTFEGSGYTVAQGIYEGGIFRSERDTMDYQKQRKRVERKMRKERERQPGFWSSNLPPDALERAER